MNMRTKVLLFFYSYQNILGSGLGLLGLALYFTGIIDRGWLLIVAGLYTLGFLIARYSFGTSLDLIGNEVYQSDRGLSTEKLLDEVSSLQAKVQRRLPKRAVELLHSIGESLSALLPRLHTDNPALVEQTHTVERTVRVYLPATLQNYLRLPPAFARLHPLKEGKTAQDLLIEQMELLDDQIKEMLTNALADDAQALMTNGRFLESKFKRFDFLPS